MKSNLLHFDELVKKRSAFVVTALVTSALWLSACQPVQPVATNNGGATTAPTEAATEETTEEATAEPTGEATVEASGEETAATTQATQALADKLQVSADTIEVVSVEAVEWRDSCLGVEVADTMCMQVITPGYRVVLSADGQQYEYHTNEDGTNVLLASEPGA